MSNGDNNRAPRSSGSLLNSFNHAINGFLHSFKMERNMKIHVTLAVAVAIAAVLAQVTRFEMIALAIVVGFVFFAELLNTAIEAAVDILVGGKYSELAKTAKDVSAGAVLVAAMCAVIVGFLVFYRKLYSISTVSIGYLTEMPAYLTFAALLLVFIAVIFIKSRYIKKGGNYVQGGMPSGHTALAFCLFTAIGFVSHDPVVMIFAAILAAVVAESRMETKVHTFAEVLVGALLGMVITVIIFEIADLAASWSVPS